MAIDEGATLTLTGSRIPVLVATKSARILGALDVSAQGIVPGAGFANIVDAGRGESADSSTSEGGGGAGFATRGGQAGANPGEAYGSADLVPLVPGSAGGAGGFGCHDICPLSALVFPGGGSGGAAHLVGCESLELGPSSLISAGGGGGPGGHGGTLGGPPGGGGGGGSGGAILIEAPQIRIGDGVRIAANGGGGGGGGAVAADAEGAAGEAGENGRASRVPARGGPGGSGVAANGGDGGTADGQGAGIEPGRGSSAKSGGGGGGAAGRIRLNTRPDRPVSISANALVTPSPSTGAIARH